MFKHLSTTYIFRQGNTWNIWARTCYLKCEKVSNWVHTRGCTRCEVITWQLRSRHNWKGQGSSFLNFSQAGSFWTKIEKSVYEIRFKKRILNDIFFLYERAIDLTTVNFSIKICNIKSKFQLTLISFLNKWKKMGWIQGTNF